MVHRLWQWGKIWRALLHFEIPRGFQVPPRNLLQSALTNWRRTEAAYIPSMDGRCHSARMFVMAAAIVACIVVGVAMVEAQDYGGGNTPPAASGPGSSTSSAEWLYPASLVVSFIVFSTAFLHLWWRTSFFQLESAGISWATPQRCRLVVWRNEGNRVCTEYEVIGDQSELERVMSLSLVVLYGSILWAAIKGFSANGNYASCIV